MPKLSIIIPSYNRAELLKLALESVLAQTFQHFEAIVADYVMRNLSLEE